MNKKNFWKNKRVLITGHTGFKGSWLSLWLSQLGSEIIGYSLKPTTTPNLFNILDLNKDTTSIYADIRDKSKLMHVVEKFKPEIIFHLAAQSIVTTSYINPIETLEVNIMGTANLLHISKDMTDVKVVVNITSDKCYENREQLWGYRENDSMGGYDPYSCSKGCSELVTNSFRNSYYNKKNIMLASARAGNVIGGGDWADNRLLPDIIRGLKDNKEIEIRNPNAIRPWQHVLEPLSGYIMLAEKLWEGDRDFSEGWNFGPNESNVANVREVVNKAAARWSNDLYKTIKYYEDNSLNMHEASILKLDSSKAKYKLDWVPKLDINQTINWTIDWYLKYYEGNDMRKFTLAQIKKYEDIG